MLSRSVVYLTALSATLLAAFNGAAASPINKRDDEMTYGDATWFIASDSGSIGACGEFEPDDGYIAALNGEQYGDMDAVSDDCFRKVRIYHDGKSVDATITDACPGCTWGSLDLTPVVFEELDDLDIGVIDIKWRFLD
ncbi:RlpA-like double-psi beta-barrel-protein domain-containing protein-containing protein [Mycotypha africana]|uniref:RlpA-like double-psi beta-barrel-protein domain-containing protein-containing protein n=1 Tax=Mycotypha africana TaxID=64632 RepID=UPI0022FFF2F1|nr:RlpA-like double-psi beta-barrel-protein domain-containing protein-containing protein [Mycotypha africana]KAI8970257.1 RlpA-like double-psi beta-barrel-protein domain-containing protein-containing protein [Mycotypha africana]